MTAIRKHAITIGGDIGAGKTTVAELIHSWSKLELMVVGRLCRAEATLREVTFDKLQVLMKKDITIDLAIDERQKEFLKSRDEFLADSRLSVYFAPDAFNVYLTVDPMIGAKRNFKALSKDPHRLAEANISSVEKVLESNKQRLESERARYAKLYRFDYTDLRHYDLVLSTNHLKNYDVANIVFETFKQWRKTLELV